MNNDGRIRDRIKALLFGTSASYHEYFAFEILNAIGLSTTKAPP